MKASTIKILQALMQNSKLSDRKIADGVGVSQPTVTRQRHAMEKSDIIQGYITLVDLAKLGFEIEAYSIIPQKNINVDDLKSDRRVIFVKKLAAANNDKLLVMSVHKNYADYDTFAIRYKISEGDSFLALASTEPIKSFGFGDIEIVT